MPWSLSHSILLLIFALDVSQLIHEFLYVVIWMTLDLSELLHGFFLVVTWICQSCYMDLLKLLHGFVKVVLFITQPLPSKTKLKFDQDFKACEASVVYY